MYARGDGLDIAYKNKAIEEVCTCADAVRKKYGSEMARKIHKRIDELAAADSVEEMIKYHIGRCHPLHNDRKEQYALDLVHPQRLVFEKKGTTIQVANVLEIIDYH